VPISHYPRPDHCIAPQTLHEILNVRVSQYLTGVSGLAHDTKLCDLDETTWNRVDRWNCHTLGDIVVACVSDSKTALLERLGNRLLPTPPVNVALDDLELETRTYNCLKQRFSVDLRPLGRYTIKDVLSISSFSIKSLVDLLTSVESYIAQKDSISISPDHRAAARYYVAQLCNRYPFLRRKLQASLDFQLAQYEGSSDKEMWVRNARAAFDTKVKNELLSPPELPLWPTTDQPAFDFPIEEGFEDDSEKSGQPSITMKTNLHHDPRLGDVLSSVSDETSAFQTAAHAVVALMHSNFDPHIAKEQLKRMRGCIQVFYQVVTILEQLADQVEPGHSLPLQLNAELTYEAQQIKVVWGAAAIQCNDPRLGPILRPLFATINPDAETLGDLMDSIITRTYDPPLVNELLKQVREFRQYISVLSQVPLEDEFFGFVNISHSGTISERNEEVIARRYGWDGQEGGTLQAIADEFDISRERVRQICQPVEETFNTFAAKKPFAPVLDRVLSFVVQHAPLTVSDMEAKLANTGLTKAPLHVKGLLRMAECLGREMPFFIEQTGRTLSGQPFVVRSSEDLKELQTQSNTMNEIVSIARKVVSRWGVATVEDIVARVVERHQMEGTATVNTDLAFRILVTQSDFEWLDQEHGWFWLSSVPRNSLLTQIKKVLAVAGRIRVAELRAAVSRHHRRGGFAPPQRVLLELCRQTPGYCAEASIIIADPPLDVSEVLFTTESFMVQILKEHGPLMQRAVFEKYCADIPRGTFYQYLNYSPVIQRYAKGVYGLPGTDVKPGVVELLIPDHHWRRRRGHVLLDFGWVSEGKIWLGYRVSEHMLTHGIGSIPTTMKAFLTEQFALQTADGFSVGTLVCADNQMRGLLRFR
jgi:Sigma-70, region 4